MEKHLLITRFDSVRAARGEMLAIEDVLEILSVPLLGFIPESIPRTNATLSSRNGSAATSMPTMLITRGSLRTSQCWRSSGPGPRPYGALAARSRVGYRNYPRPRDILTAAVNDKIRAPGRMLTLCRQEDSISAHRPRLR